MIHVKCAEFRFPSAERLFIRIKDLTLGWSGVGTLSASSGSGKTTFFRLLSGWYAPHGGVCEFGGSLAPHNDVRFVGAHSSLLPWRTVLANLHLRLPSHSAAEIVDLLRRVDLSADVSVLYPYQLSLGMYKRVEFVAAVECRPTLLLLDEFYSSIDDRQKEILSEFIRSRRGDGLTWVIAHERGLRQWIGGPEFHFVNEEGTIVGVVEK